MYTYTYIYTHDSSPMSSWGIPHKKIEETDGSERVFIIGKYFITTNNFKKQKQKNDITLW